MGERAENLRAWIRDWASWDDADEIFEAAIHCAVAAGRLKVQDAEAAEQIRRQLIQAFQSHPAVIARAESIEFVVDRLRGEFNSGINEGWHEKRFAQDAAILALAESDSRRANLGYEPFPVEWLPEPLQDFVDEAARAIGCDPAYVALPVLAVAAMAVGNSRSIRLKAGWTEPAVLWAATIGDSGDRKSPPFRKALRPLIAAEQDWHAEYADETEAHNGRAVLNADPGPKPVRRRVLTEDATIEALAPILAENPRGLLNARDELDDWFQGQVRYKGGSGANDRARWLKLHSADTLTVDRKTGDQRHFHIPLAACSVAGTIQPGVFEAAAGKLAVESGQLARFVMAHPPSWSPVWSDAEVSDETEAAYDSAIRATLDLEMGTDAKGRAAPVVLRLSAEAKEEWVEFYDRMQVRKPLAGPAMKAALSKLEGAAARFALIHHVVTEAAAGRDATAPVGADSMAAGVGLTEWFANEARRLYKHLGRADDERELADLETLVRNLARDRGGRCRPRDLQRSGHGYKTAADAKTALERLVRAGLGTWMMTASERGGHATHEFVLAV